MMTDHSDKRNIRGTTCLTHTRRIKRSHGLTSHDQNQNPLKRWFSAPCMATVTCAGTAVRGSINLVK